MGPEILTKLFSAIAVGLFGVVTFVTLAVPMAYGLFDRRP